MKLIKEKLKQASDRQKILVDKNRTFRQFFAGDKVLFIVRPQKSSISFGKNSKLAPRFIGTFDVLEVINLVAYRLSLPPTLSRIPNVSHVSVLKPYHLDVVHILD